MGIHYKWPFSIAMLNYQRVPTTGEEMETTPTQKHLLCHDRRFDETPQAFAETTEATRQTLVGGLMMFNDGYIMVNNG